MSFEVDSTVDAPPSAVFDKMADAGNETHWNSQVSRSELVSGDPIGESSRFETVNRSQVYQAEITKYDRPNRITFEVTGKRMDITAEFTFTPSGDANALHATYDFRPKAFFKVLFPLMRPLVAKDLPEQSQSFARFAERD